MCNMVWFCKFVLEVIQLNITWKKTTRTDNMNGVKWFVHLKCVYIELVDACKMKLLSKLDV
jgi:hypothetical protein